MRTKRFSLGAEELIELGNGRVGVNLDRKPFLSGRTRNVRLSLGSSKRMGQDVDLLAEVAPYVANRLNDSLSALADILDMPVMNLGQSVEIVSKNVSGLLERIPSIKDLLEQILVLGGVLVKYGLTVPDMLLRNLGNLIGGIGVSLSQLGEGELQGGINQAKQDIAEQSGDSLKDSLTEIMNRTGVSGNDPVPNINVTTGQVMVPAFA